MNRELFFSSKRDTWTTPKKLFNDLNNKYNFTLDACADYDNHLCDKYYTLNNSCFNHTFLNERVFMNPPYSRKMYDFIKKCYYEMYRAELIVLLVPARTDTKWFHEFIYNKQDVRIEFIKGRLKFGDGKSAAPFPSMLVYFNC